MQRCKKCGANSVVVAGAGSRNLFIMTCKNRGCKAEYVERLSIQTFISSLPKRRQTAGDGLSHPSGPFLDM